MSSDSQLEADWPAPPNVRAFTSLRGGPGVSLPPFDCFNLGSRCGDEPGHVLENRQRMISEFGLPAAPRWLRQVHGIDVARIDDLPASLGDEFDEPQADAAVTTQPDTVLAILTADCLPVVFCNDDGSEIAAAHAGWRGLAAGMLEATVRAMRSPPESVMAWLGPAAGRQAYEIGAEVRDAFLAVDAYADTAFTPTQDGHWLVDLYLLARQRLAAAGVERVYGGGMCTISDSERFYSHRRDQRTGRMATVIYRSS
jgi:hypothetical protein